MRTLLLAALSLSALTPSRDADACGGYVREPRILQLAAHVVASDGKGSELRTFALFGTATPPANIKWRRLDPMSFDTTSVAHATPLANAVTLTLLGPSGTRVVSSTKHVFLSRSSGLRKTASALDIGDVKDFTIALEGVHPTATWTAVEDVSYTNARKMAAWVKAQGADASSVYVSRVKGTPFETVSVWTEGSTKTVTFLKRGDDNLGRFDGSPIGAFTNKGITQLVLVDGAQVSTAYLGG
jgi:hypothetical protein